ncbi:uncharacterized protein LOC144324694 [Canis aureus]
MPWYMNFEDRVPQALHNNSSRKKGDRPSGYPSGCELKWCDNVESTNGKPPSRNPTPCQHIPMSLHEALEEYSKGTLAAAKVVEGTNQGHKVERCNVADFKQESC